MQTQAESSLAQRLSRPFITGVIGFLPLALTLAVLAWVVVFVHDLVGPSSAFGKVLASFGLNFVACEVLAWAAGMIVLLLAIYGLGTLIERGAGHRYQNLVEDVMQRVPLVSTVYDASKHLTSMFDRKSDAVKMMTPVYCTFGGAGGAVMLALMPNPQPIRIAGRDYQVVIIPTAPVPFGGALLLVPVEAIKPADCSLDGLVNIFMSMGVSASDFLGTRPGAVLGDAASPSADSTDASSQTGSGPDAP